MLNVLDKSRVTHVYRLPVRTTSETKIDVQTQPSQQAELHSRVPISVPTHVVLVILKGNDTPRLRLKQGETYRLSSRKFERDDDQSDEPRCKEALQLGAARGTE